jgi:3-dehydroquinate dehydratase-2
LKVLVINGPNLNLLGVRDTGTYGSKTLDQLEVELISESKKLSCDVDFFRSNHEGEIVSRISESINKYDAIIINPGALTHYSYSIRDALEAFSGKKVEVHISNIYSREEFRRKSVISQVVDGVISGFGTDGYLLAIKWLVHKLK